MDDRHAVQELSTLLLGAPQLHHAVRHRHDLAEEDFMDATNGFIARLSVHVMPCFLVGDGLQLHARTFTHASKESRLATRDKPPQFSCPSNCLPLQRIVTQMDRISHLLQSTLPERLLPEVPVLPDRMPHQLVFQELAVFGSALPHLPLVLVLCVLIFTILSLSCTRAAILLLWSLVIFNFLVECLHK